VWSTSTTTGTGCWCSSKWQWGMQCRYNFKDCRVKMYRYHAQFRHALQYVEKVRNVMTIWLRSNFAGIHCTIVLYVYRQKNEIQLLKSMLTFWTQEFPIFCIKC
jgi:hypothetical protein